MLGEPTTIRGAEASGITVDAFVDWQPLGTGRVTIQAAPQLGGLLFVLAAAAVIALGLALGIQLARRRTRAVRVLAVFLTGLVGVYGATLALVGVISSPLQLHAGDVKCFDDWCAGMTAARRSASGTQVLIDLRLENRGRGRAMKSNLARAFVEVPGGGILAPVDGRTLQTVIEADDHADVELVFPAAAAAPGARFIVAEGADTIGPGTFTVGDEASPFHARAGWPLRVT